MSDRNPNVPQSDDADLQASLVRLLRVIGPLGRLGIADFIVPVVNMGDVVTRQIVAMQPVFGPGDIFTAGVQTAAPAFTEHARTDNLPVGTYDLQLHISPHTTEAHVWDIEYQDPAEPLPVPWSFIVPIDGPGVYQTLAFDFDNNAFIRIRNTTVFGAGVQSVATIFARLRT